LRDTNTRTLQLDARARLIKQYFSTTKPCQQSWSLVRTECYHNDDQCVTILSNGKNRTRI